MICAVANHKGGVGKTSVTVSLGAALAIQGKRVLIVDNDPQANATSILIPDGALPPMTMNDILDPENQPLSPDKVEAAVYPAYSKNLFVIPNMPDTSGHEIDFAHHIPECFSYLRNSIRPLAQDQFDVTLIDCPPTLSFFVSQAFHAADAVIVPVEAGSSFAMGGLNGILQLIKETQESGNPDLRFLRILVNRVDLRTTVSKMIIGLLHEKFGKDQVFKATIPANTAVQQAEAIRETIFKHAPGSRAAQSYRKLAREFIHTIEGDR